MNLRRVFASYLLLTCLVFAHFCPPALALSTGDSPVVVTRHGPIAGRMENGVAVYRGIPFAAAPTGALRWREPQPPLAWEATRDAGTFGLACLQNPAASIEADVGAPGPMGEDCLNLNVWTPTSASQHKRAVMVWIHGGALVIGAGSLPLYDGKWLAQRDVVVVTINYRMGALGFFSHPALDAESPGGPANFGLLDQIAALRWVQENIEAFGGDRSRVTIFGESAGAQSVLALMSSPKAKGLFAGAIAQSPYGLLSHSRRHAAETGVQMATSLGLAGASASLQELRALSAEKFEGASDPSSSLAPNFIVGDAALPEPILSTFQDGHEANVPLIIGSNSDDSSVVSAFGVDPADLIAKLGAARVLVKPLYPGVRNDRELGRQVSRDAVFTAFARRIAFLHSDRAPTWRYYFDYQSSSQPPGLGAVHGAEIPYVFATGQSCRCLRAPPTVADTAVSGRLADAWVAFAKTGTASIQGANWTRDGKLASRTLVITKSPVLRKEFMAPRLNALILALKGAGGVLSKPSVR